MDSPIAFLELQNKILYIKVRKNVVFNKDTVKEHLKAQEELVGSMDYAVLVDTSNQTETNPSKDSRMLLARHNPPNKKAIAILTDGGLTQLTLFNTYIKVDDPTLPTRLFTDENEAIKWLRGILDQ